MSARRRCASGLLALCFAMQLSLSQVSLSFGAPPSLSQLNDIQWDSSRQELLLQVSGEGFDPEFSSTRSQQGYVLTITGSGVGVNVPFQQNGGLLTQTVRQALPELTQVTLSPQPQGNGFQLVIITPYLVLAQVAANGGDELRIRLLPKRPQNLMVPSPVTAQGASKPPQVVVAPAPQEPVAMSAVSTHATAVNTTKSYPQNKTYALSLSKPTAEAKPQKAPITIAAVEPSPTERSPYSSTRGTSTPSSRSASTEPLLPYNQGQSAFTQFQSAQLAGGTTASGWHRYWHALNMIQTGAYERAIEDLRPLVDKKSDTSEPLYRLASLELLRARMLLNQFDEANKVLNKALSQWPQDPEFRFQQGVLQEADGQTEAARLSYLNALALDPDNVLYHYRLAMACIKLNLVEEATWELQRVLVYRPDDPSTLKALGFLAQKKQDATGAEGYYTKALPADLLINYGHLLLKQNKQEEALALFQTADALYPTHPDIQYNIGMLYADLQATDLARRALTRFVNLMPPTGSGPTPDPRLAKAQQRLQSL